MPHLLIIQSYGFQRGGSASFLVNLVSCLNRQKFDVHLLFLSHGYLLEKTKGMGIPTHFINSRKLSNIPCFIYTIKEIITLIDKEKIDIVFSNDVRSHIYGGLAALLAQIPSLFYWHGLFCTKLLSKIAVSIPAKAIVFNSNFNRDRFISSYPKLICKSCTVYPGVPLKDSEQEHSNYCITMIGLLMEWKGQEYFIRAAPLILKKFPKTRFLIVGDIQSPSDVSYKKYLQNLVNKLHLENSILFMGYRNDISNIIHSSNIIVHTSTSPEPFGMVITEAMAYGKPVVATDIGGPKEIIEDGLNGILIPPGDEGAIADACIKLLQDPKRAKDLGRKGRDKVKKQFSAQIMTEKMESILTSVLTC